MSTTPDPEGDPRDARSRREDEPAAEAPAREDPFPADDERLWAMGAHLSGAAFSFVGPLVVRLAKPSGSAYLRENVRAALNFQLVVFLAWLGTWALYLVPCLRCLGWPANLVVLFANAAIAIVAGIHAYDGKRFRYPVDPRWID